MYRLAVYYTASLILLAVGLSIGGYLPYNPVNILLPAVYIVVVSYLSNVLFSKILKTTASAESAFITGLILALIVGPAALLDSLLLLTFVPVAAMASKYVLAWRGRHIFNPAAFGVFASAIILGEGASWWVGDSSLIWLVIVFGILLVHKIREWKIIGSFLLVYFAGMLVLSSNGGSLVDTIPALAEQLTVYSPILFFTFIMLPEPKTSPRSGKQKLLYGAFTAIVLIIYQTQLNVGYSLEMALLTGNAFAFLASKETRTKFVFKKKEKEAESIFLFWFKPKKKFTFKPGQFLEYTLNHKHPDQRGVRRYFTIASSPTEDQILLTAKILENGSTFKKNLMQLQKGDSVVAVGPQGSFTLPDNEDDKLVFIAGGVGITPFRSMIKYLLDNNFSRDITLFYMANSPEEFAFDDIFEKAKQNLNLNVVKMITNAENSPSEWSGEVGIINSDIIKKNVPDWQNRQYYVSGPKPMVHDVSKMLVGMNIDKSNIKRDFFPGYEEI